MSSLLGALIYAGIMASLGVGAIAVLFTERCRAIAFASLLAALLLAALGAVSSPSITLGMGRAPQLHVEFTGPSLVFTLVALVGSMLVLLEAPSSGSDNVECMLLLASAVGLTGLFTTISGFWLLFFWESTVLPLFYAAWRRGARRGALYFLAYTQASGILLLAGVSLLRAMTGSWSLAALGGLGGLYRGIFLAFMVSAAIIKAPIFPLHSWLPILYREAPATISSMSVLMTKMGLYLLAVLAMSGLTPSTPYLGLLALVGSIYALLVAHSRVREGSLREAAAYISMAHMGLAFAAIVSPTAAKTAIQTALLFTIAHTFSLIPLLAASELVEMGMAPGASLLAASSTLTLPLPGLATFAAELVALFSLYGSPGLGALLLALGLATSILGVSISSWLIYMGLSMQKKTGLTGSLAALILSSVIILLAAGIAPSIVEALA